MEIKDINRAKRQANKKAKEDAKEAKKMMEEETEGDTDADTDAASKAFMAEGEEILAEARDRASTPAGLIADKLINLCPAPGPVLSNKSLLDWKVGSGRGVKVRMRYGGLEKEKKGGGGEVSTSLDVPSGMGEGAGGQVPGGQEGHRLLHRCGDEHRVRRREVRRWTCTHDTV
jgi:hypothetical protein